jgi:hypothetical protein
MDRDLTVYTYHPRPRILWAPLAIIAGMAILGLVRGLMGADLDLEAGLTNRGPAQTAGKEPRPVVLETIPSLTPRLIGAAPPAPKAPVAVNAPVVDLAPAINAAVNAPAPIPPAIIKTEPAPTEAPPSAPANAPPTPQSPPTALQGLY